MGRFRGDLLPGRRGAGLGAVAVGEAGLGTGDGPVDPRGQGGGQPLRHCREVAAQAAARQEPCHPGSDGGRGGCEPRVSEGPRPSPSPLRAPAPRQPRLPGAAPASELGLGIEPVSGRCGRTGVEGSCFRELLPKQPACGHRSRSPKHCLSPVVLGPWAAHWRPVRAQDTPPGARPLLLRSHTRFWGACLALHPFAKGPQWSWVQGGLRPRAGPPSTPMPWEHGPQRGAAGEGSVLPQCAGRVPPVA